MGRLWLALALLAALVATAAAKPACTCRSEVILPRAGATGVPTNARFWDIPASGITSTPDQRIQVYELAAHTTYELSSPHLSFTTGEGRDDTPPVDPRIDKVAITLGRTGAGGVHPVSVLQIAGTFSSDTAIVRVTLTAPSGTTVLYTTSDQLSICDLALSFAPGNVDVSIMAIDLAGNQSSPVTYNASAMVGDEDVVPCDERQHHWQGSCVPFFLFEELGWWVLGTLAYITPLVIISSARTRRRHAITPEPIALPAVEALGRAIRRTAILRFAAVGVAITIAMRDSDLRGYLWIASAAFATFVFVTAAGWAAASNVLRLASFDGATATVRGDEVTVEVGGKNASMRTAPWRVRRARRHAIPRASVDLK
jgi:hypothetical protein